MAKEKFIKNLYRLQNRIFKSVLLGDLVSAVQAQKILLASNSCLLVAIDEVVISYKENSLYLIIDHNVCWQYAIRFALEPICDALSDTRTKWSPTSLHYMQKVLCVNFKDSLSIQKRIVSLTLQNCFINVEYFQDFLVKSIIAPRYIKSYILCCLILGLKPSFSNTFSKFSVLSNILAEILINDLEYVHSYFFRCSENVIFLLKPIESEKFVFFKLSEFLFRRGLDNTSLKWRLASSFYGFDFIGWNFRSPLNSLVCRPSLSNYTNFNKQFLFIINNSSYSSHLKLAKLNSLLTDWQFHNKLCNIDKSLSFLRKKAFENFSKDLNQDLYSVKRIIKAVFRNQKDNISLDRHITFEYLFSGFCIICGKHLRIKAG